MYLSSVGIGISIIININKLLYLRSLDEEFMFTTKYAMFIYELLKI